MNDVTFSRVFENPLRIRNFTKSFKYKNLHIPQFTGLRSES